MVIAHDFEKVQPAIGARLPFDSQIARSESTSPPTSLNQPTSSTINTRYLHCLFAMLFALSPSVVRAAFYSLPIEASRLF